MPRHLAGFGVVVVALLVISPMRLAAQGSADPPDYSAGWELRATSGGAWGGVVAGTPELGYVVLGTSRGGDGLHSVDGVSWEPIALPAGSGVSVVDLDASAKGFVAVARPNSVSAGTEYPPYIWYSPDGRTWDRIDPENLPLSTLTNGAVEQISASDQGFAVVVVDDCPALVWFSENGREWSQSSIESGCWAIELAAVAGGWVALTGKREVTVFATVDGLAWTSVESPDNSASPGANFATLPERLLAGRFAPRQSFVASGDTLVFSREGGVWTSTDGGRSWIETSFARGSQVGPTFPMTSTNLGFVGVAIHSGSSQGGMRPIALVSSTDGLNWTEQPTDLLLWDLAGAGDSVIAVELGGGVYTWTPPGSELLAHTGTDPTVLALIGTCFVALGGVLLAWRRRQAIMHPETG